MGFLSAHLQSVYNLYHTKTGYFFGLTNSANKFFNWRVGSVSSSFVTLGIEGGSQRSLASGSGIGWAKKACNLQCRRVAAADALPSTVEGLNARFGQAGVKFVEAGGYQIVEMKLKNGSSARIVLQSAVVSSYKDLMWHGGVEELLHTQVVPGDGELQRPTMVGGINIGVWEAEAEGESILAVTECWDVENVRSTASEYVQVALTTISRGTSRNCFSSSHVLHFKYVVTLSQAGLSCAIIISNIGNSAVNISASIKSNIAVNYVDGAFALGLRGYKYLSRSPNSIRRTLSQDMKNAAIQEAKGTQGFPSKLHILPDLEKDEMGSSSGTATDDLSITEEEEFVRFRGGFDRLYSAAPDCISLLDRGKRRTINFHSIGYEDVRLTNPGEESGLEDWDSFVSVELGQLTQPVSLQPGQEWKAAQQLENPSK